MTTSRNAHLFSRHSAYSALVPNFCFMANTSELVHPLSPCVANKPAKRFRICSSENASLPRAFPAFPSLAGSARDKRTPPHLQNIEPLVCNKRDSRHTGHNTSSFVAEKCCVPVPSSPAIIQRSCRSHASRVSSFSKSSVFSSSSASILASSSRISSSNPRCISAIKESYSTSVNPSAKSSFQVARDEGVETRGSESSRDVF
mmetsp:Transcript_1159/g.4590  ORF Transcript_1159/g.4590 Transcript_1159/m.4590 type:complete len:202 (+) Transcript_1159:40-645(+)